MLFLLFFMLFLFVCFFNRQSPYQAESKKRCQYEDLIGTGLTKLPIVLGKMADYGERKESCRFSGLAA